MLLRLETTADDMPSPQQVVDAVRNAFIGLATGGSVQPPQIAVPLPARAGDCIIYTACDQAASAIGVKVSPYLHGRLERGLPPTTAYTLVLDARDGRPRFLVDAQHLTTERAGATTAIAVDQILSDLPKEVSIVGTGQIGRAHARYVEFLFPETSITMFSPSAAAQTAAGEERRRTIAKECPRARIAAHIDDAVAASDVVMLCTSSYVPVIDVQALRSDVLLTSVGTNFPDAHEVAPEQLAALTVYCDYRATCAQTAGELRLAQEAGSWDASQIHGDLPELLTQARRPVAKGRRYFRATGLAVEDIAVGALLAASA